MIRWLLLALLGGAVWGEPADLVLRGGAIYTVDAQRSWAQALAVRDGRIVYVGSDAGVADYTAPEVIDLQGKMVLPGFCDSHVHPLLAGLESRRCALNDLASVQAVKNKVLSYARSHPDLPWIVGSGWGLPLFPQANPHRRLLDEWIRERPVALESADGHSMWLNSRALEVCGITAATPDPADGRIERDADGSPSGTLRENAVKLAQAHLPRVSLEERCQALRWGLQRLAGLGVTSFFEANAGPEDLAAYHQLEQAGELTARVVAAQTLGEVGELVAHRERYTGQLLAPSAVKIFMDGVIEARTAAVLEPYAGSSEKGTLNLEPAEMKRRVAEFAGAGFQVHVHAIGDRAVRTALDSLAAAPGQDLRHTIAHLQLIDPADIPRFRQLGVVANVQAYWCMADEYVTRLSDPLLGPERARRQYPLASLWRSGAVMVGGSDWSVSTPNPLEAIEVALTRRQPGSQDPAWLPEERLELAPMLAAYTINGAYLCHRQKEAGSLEVGKWADLIVLDHNLFELPPERIHTARVVLTLLGGRRVYSAK